MTSQLNATMTISVVRNEHPPIFESDPYTVDIAENKPTNELVTTVKANDADQTVIDHFIFPVKFEFIEFEEQVSECMYVWVFIHLLIISLWN